MGNEIVFLLHLMKKVNDLTKALKY
ncbi:hypothetical protein XBKQ1_210006 [Xenorhabdus bovienii str. kraussei Quebec]|uniref:Uncharacterized protein n=5 Tax=Xenorhabdus bovienii TaxID=40576 RepID=A0A077PDU2_XENBV|nr:hypothetical protein XBFFR1_2630018 [Xenorhabdus bovienii str. feltiae France]CDG92569.1 hypothetical protein XBFFL1_2240018 [Xenorhabdus bovienii str. feltiae Florida]CDG96194.1 hypothetical protein XBP1_1970016 [Xenorhabdus bovienii str. puntauvense]CDH03862.1 hypothetical protein XBFM1_860056 [Xenorhabdus bovienii str. feltiae Moldova]CDH19333.1 hypothetical protein XBKQ1_210006 [Xenorhabdus bovienii str. kraussei Quebec]CDH24399.1 hypothetical protein XBKB1_2740007 [Xenorhabdus bovienii